MQKTYIANYIILSIRSNGWVGLLLGILEHEEVHRRPCADTHNKLYSWYNWNGCLTVKCYHHTQLSVLMEKKVGGGTYSKVSWIYVYNFQYSVWKSWSVKVSVGEGISFFFTSLNHSLTLSSCCCFQPSTTPSIQQLRWFSFRLLSVGYL